MKKPQVGPAAPCPCGTGRPFGECCGPVLARTRAAGSPEELMRSRFTAHVVHDWAHLHRTHLESSREPFEEPEQEGATDWTRLVIHGNAPGSAPEKATVDFTAYFAEGDLERAHHENAEFEKIDGTWFYLRPLRQGLAPVRSQAAKVGRNDPCPCGSGKKHKQCCLGKKPTA